MTILSELNMLKENTNNERHRTRNKMFNRMRYWPNISLSLLIQTHTRTNRNLSLTLLNGMEQLFDVTGKQKCVLEQLTLNISILHITISPFPTRANVIHCYSTYGRRPSIPSNTHNHKHTHRDTDKYTQKEIEKYRRLHTE